LFNVHIHDNKVITLHPSQTTEATKQLELASVTKWIQKKKKKKKKRLCKQSKYDILGFQAIINKECVDLVASNMAKIELIKGAHLLPMMHIQEKVMEELILPLKNALIVKLLDKNLGYNIMKTKLEALGIEWINRSNGCGKLLFHGEI